MKFTDALTNYLEAKKDFDEAKDSYEGDAFHYHMERQCRQFQEAEDALNKFFESKEQA